MTTVLVSPISNICLLVDTTWIGSGVSHDASLNIVTYFSSVHHNFRTICHRRRHCQRRNGNFLPGNFISRLGIRNAKIGKCKNCRKDKCSDKCFKFHNSNFVSANIKILNIKKKSIHLLKIMGLITISRGASLLKMTCAILSSRTSSSSSK